MTSSGPSSQRERWRRFVHGSIRFDLIGDPPRLIRLRDRDGDNGHGNAFAVIDLWTLKVVDTEFVPRRKPGQQGEH